MDHRAPRATVLRLLAPPLEVRRDARVLERLVQRMPERELWTPMRPWPADPGSEKLPRPADPGLRLYDTKLYIKHSCGFLTAKFGSFCVFFLDVYLG